MSRISIQDLSLPLFPLPSHNDILNYEQTTENIYTHKHLG